MNGVRRGMVLGALVLACGEAAQEGSGTASAGSTGRADTTATESAAGTNATTGTSSAGADTGFIFDVMQSEDMGRVQPTCTVSEDMDAPLPCIDVAPPDSFDPDVQWSWDPPEGQGDLLGAVVTPLVANLTDDNGDGAIDLCDIPDIVLAAGELHGPQGVRLYVLDGATGAEHWRSELGVSGIVSPALGDIDADGLPEIVVGNDANGGVRVYEHDGQLKWEIADAVSSQATAIALADVDLDGDVEISVGASLLDHEGTVLWTLPGEAVSYLIPAAVPVDLDGNDTLEIVLGRTAANADGSIYYRLDAVSPGYPQVADLDGDLEPEVLVVNHEGLALIEHDGALTYAEVNPTGVPLGPGFGAWLRPAAIHDLDGDDEAEFAVSALDVYAAYEPDASFLWSAMVLDASGRASGTAFDFLGDGIAEAIYADETTLHVFDGDGQSLMGTPRSSPTHIEYPIVADVDNDASAEIVVVSMGYGGRSSPALQVIRDADDRWIPARRIWNQHVYHVTNVREDGTIPSPEPKHWLGLNTFRTQAQVLAGGSSVCEPAG